MKASISDYFIYYLYIFFKSIFLLLPKSFSKNLLIFVSSLLYKFNKKHKHIAKVNLDLTYENSISEKEKESIIKGSYKSLLFNLYEFVENQKASKETLFSKAVIKNEDIINNAIKSNRKIIFFSAHYGGWELAVPYIALKFGTVAIVNRKMNNPLINQMYKKARNRNNVVMIDKKEAAKGMIKAFKKNQHVCVVIDQHLKHGVDIDFFNKKAMATDSTARLALKFDALLIPIFCQMNDFRDYTIKVYEAIDPLKVEFKTENKEQELTQLQANIIEKQIKQEPSQWFWQHRRWKKYYEELYKRK